jgi:hypothetical protein
MIAGTGDLVEPDATLDALLPAFLFLAAFSVLAGLAFAVVKLEPHGRDLESLSADLVEQAAQREGGGGEMPGRGAPALPG